MAGAQQMLWATFEHVDNDPESATTTGHWNFYDPHSTATPAGDTPPVPCPTVGCTAWNAPTQIVRFTPIDSNARGATGSFYAALAAAGANTSVFRNYELVQVQWPAASVAVTPGAAAPLTLGGAVPAAPQPVANSVIETYMQQPDSGNDHSCMACHSGGTIASASSSLRLSAENVHARTLITAFTNRRVLLKAGASPAPQPTGTPYASDYSFLFGDLGR
jgi:hypothetical protein